VSEVVHGTISLVVGDRVLSEDGYLLVTQLGRHTVTVESSAGTQREVPYGEISGV
jgi:hypothetical protein